MNHGVGLSSSTPNSRTNSKEELKAQAHKISKLGERRKVPLSTTHDGEVRSRSVEASMKEAMLS
jgi:hypothetical protein